MFPNSGQHIHSIVDKVACGRHDAQIGIPCFRVMTETNVDVGGLNAPITLAGICNRRAIKGGANGKISDSSYRRAVKR